METQIRLRSALRDPPLSSRLIAHLISCDGPQTATESCIGLTFEPGQSVGHRGQRFLHDVGRIGRLEASGDDNAQNVPAHSPHPPYPTIDLPSIVTDGDIERSRNEEASLDQNHSEPRPAVKLRPQ